MRSSDVFTLQPLSRGSDAALLLMRLMVGSFLIFGVWDNIASAKRMGEFTGFLAGFGFPVPHLMAPLSVWAQFFCGLFFILGVATRWAGLVCAFNFAVAIVMVDHAQGIRGAFPSACLVAIGLNLATHGAGRFAIDSLVARRD